MSVVVKPDQAVVVKPDQAVQDIIDFAVTFSSLSALPQGKLRLQRSVSDLLHTLGYYAEQVKRPSTTAPDRFNTIAEALKHISEHLEA